MVAYPLLPVSERSAGGAEQILWTLERELNRRGWQTEVAACTGSEIAGRLIVTGPASRALDAFAQREREHADCVVDACRTGNYALLLDHSGSFFRHARQLSVPVLASLHLPRQLYPPETFDTLSENVSFHCVSQSQSREFTDLPRMLGVVPNGIDLSRFAPPDGPRSAAVHPRFLLWLGRVCPEKAPHLAIAAAQRAGLPIVLAGQVYPFSWHRDYWEREVRPRIDGVQVRWVELPSFAEKSRLLREAHALLLTSQIAETSSLVALEAMASGTPVVALRRGALSEIVRPGTGFLVESVEEMAAACARVDELRPEDCREWVAQHFSSAKMADGYEAMVEAVLANTAKALAS
jgi:glycosyltransferase involved in cell wall biosynthesis